MAIIPTPKANKSGSVITIPLGSSSLRLGPSDRIVDHIVFLHRVALPLVKERLLIDKAVSESNAKLGLAKKALWQAAT